MFLLLSFFVRNHANMTCVNLTLLSGPTWHFSMQHYLVFAHIHHRSNISIDRHLAMFYNRCCLHSYLQFKHRYRNEVRFFNIVKTTNLKLFSIILLIMLSLSSFLFIFIFWASCPLLRSSVVWFLLRIVRTHTRPVKVFLFWLTSYAASLCVWTVIHILARTLPFLGIDDA